MSTNSLSLRITILNQGCLECIVVCCFDFLFFIFFKLNLHNHQGPKQKCRGY